MDSNQNPGTEALNVVLIALSIVLLFWCVRANWRACEKYFPDDNPMDCLLSTKMKVVNK